MIAVPSDVARCGPAVKQSYRRVLETMLGFFQGNLDHTSNEQRHTIALTLCIVSVGGMVLTRSVDDELLQDELMRAARSSPENLGLRADDKH